MVQGPFSISLNQCCCGEAAACLDGVCFVTIEFRNVKNAVVVPDVGEQPNCPPDLGLGCNDPAEGERDQIADPQPVCTDCIDWNREWELVLVPDLAVPGQELGDGSTDFTFALGQERDTEGGGYTNESGVYNIPGGSTCFPCAEINDDTGLSLAITCGTDAEGTETVDLDLLMTINGCPIATWSWGFYIPDIFNSDRTQGVPRPALNIDNDFKDGFEPIPGEICYTPRGLCREGDDAGVFPCFIGDQTDPILTFYDRKNCYWSNDDIDKPRIRFYFCEATTDVTNPSECDVCIDETIVFDSKPTGTQDFGEFGAGTETEIDPYDQPVVAISDHVWRLEGLSFSEPGAVRVLDADLCPLATPPNSAVCTYDVFIRYGRNTSTLREGVVDIYTTDRGSGPPVSLKTGMDLGTPTDPLPLASGTLDGNHNTDRLLIDGVTYSFYKLGQIQVACDAVVVIEVRGPAEAGKEMDFDAIAFKRL